MSVQNPVVSGGQRPFIDLFGSMPTAERLAFEILSWGSEAGYSGLFRDRWADSQKLPRDIVDRVANLPKSSFPTEAVKLLQPIARTAEDIVREIRQAGAVRTVLHNLLPTQPGLSNDALAEIVTSYPDDLIGFVRINPSKPMEAAAEIRRCVASYDFKGVTMTPFWHKVRADDEACFPIYETCVELGIPIWMHTSMNWSLGTPLSFEHPLHIDAVACRFPSLTIIAGHGGWPWVQDMVAVAWRHPNVYVDTTAFRPRQISRTGSGWDMLWYFMSRTIRNKVMFGSTWTLLGMPLSDIVHEARDLGLDPVTEHHWLYANAARLFGLDKVDIRNVEEIQT